MGAGHKGARGERQFLRTQSRPLGRGRSDADRGLDAGQVLAHEARFGASSPNSVDAECPAGDEAQRQGRSQDLPAAFTLGAVERDGCGCRSWGIGCVRGERHGSDWFFL